MIYEGNCRLGDLFSSRREKGRAGLPTLSVTLNDGLVDRDDLDRKQDTNLAPEEHLLVKPGDIAYNTMRMWQGAFGLAENEGVISPAYVVVSANEKLDPKYAQYLFKTSRMLHKFWAYSYGLTEDRLRLYPNDFLKIPTTIPSRSRQVEVVKLLETADAVIRKHVQLLENTQALKSAVLQRQLRFHKSNSSRDWKEYEFGQVAARVRDHFDPKISKPQRWCVELEHIEQGAGSLNGSITTTPDSSTKCIFCLGDVLFGKLRPYLRKYWHANRDGVCSTEIWVLRANPEICTPEFLACLVQSESIMRSAAASAGSKMPRAEWDYVERTTVFIPSKAEQEKISTMLRVFDQQIDHFKKMISVLVLNRSSMMPRLFSANE